MQNEVHYTVATTVSLSIASKEIFANGTFIYPHSCDLQYVPFKRLDRNARTPKGALTSISVPEVLSYPAHC